MSAQICLIIFAASRRRSLSRWDFWGSSSLFVCRHSSYWCCSPRRLSGCCCYEQVLQSRAAWGEERRKKKRTTYLWRLVTQVASRNDLLEVFTSEAFPGSTLALLGLWGPAQGEDAPPWGCVFDVTWLWNEPPVCPLSHRPEPVSSRLKQSCLLHFTPPSRIEPTIQ